MNTSIDSEMNSISAFREKYQILVIDDDKAYLNLVCNFLRKNFYKVYGVDSFEKGFVFIQNHPVDLVVSDYFLPGEDSFPGFIEKIKTISNIPFIVMSGYDDIETVIQVMKLGSRDFLVKDSDLFDILLGVLDRIFNEQNTLIELNSVKKALSDYEHVFKLITDSIADIILTISKKGKIHFFGKALYRLLGYSQNNPLSLEFQDILTDSSFHLIQNCIQKFQLNSDKKSDDTEIIMVDLITLEKQLIPAEAKITPVYNQNNEIYEFVAVIRDIRERISHENEKIQIQKKMMENQKIKALGQLAGGIAHDFNNFLTAIQGYLDLGITSLEKNSETYENLVDAREVSFRAVEMVQQIMLFGRNTPKNFQNISLKEFLTDYIRILSSMVEENIILNLHISEGLAPIWADKTYLEQIFLNLLLNSRQAMENGGVIEIIVSEYSSNYIQVEFKDNGKGIEKEIQEQIFEPFFTTKISSHGTGLGLAVVYRCLIQMEGSITVESSPHSGTVFQILLPVSSKREKLNQTHEKESSNEKLPVQGKGLVLVIEDKKEVLDFCSKLLSRFGYQVLKSINLCEAENLIEENIDQISVVLCDIVLPDGNGFQYMKKMRLKFPHLKIILSSGYFEEFDAEEFEKNNFSFLSKPYRYKKLLECIEQKIHSTI